MLYDMSLTYGRHIVHRVTDCFICAALGAKHKDSLHAAIVMEGLEQPFPKEWLAQVSIRSRKPERFKKPDKRSFRDLLEEAFL